MKHIKTLKIDIDKKNFEVIPSVQYDSNTRFLHIQLLNDSVPFDITGCSVVLSGVKEDGNQIFNSCDIINSEIGFIQAEVTEQMNAIPGYIDCEIKIYDGEGVLTSKKFTIKVTASQTSRAVESTGEFKALTEALSKVNNIDNKMNRGESVKVSQIDKNTGKFDQTYLSDSVLQMMAGNTPVNSVPADGGVTTEKLAEGATTLSKLAAETSNWINHAMCRVLGKFETITVDSDGLGVTVTWQRLYARIRGGSSVRDVKIAVCTEPLHIGNNQFLYIDLDSPMSGDEYMPIIGTYSMSNAGLDTVIGNKYIIFAIANGRYYGDLALGSLLQTPQRSIRENLLGDKIIADRNLMTTVKNRLDRSTWDIMCMYNSNWDINAVSNKLTIRNTGRIYAYIGATGNMPLKIEDKVLLEIPTNQCAYIDLEETEMLPENVYPIRVTTNNFTSGAENGTMGFAHDRKIILWSNSYGRIGGILAGHLIPKDRSTEIDEIKTNIRPQAIWYKMDKKPVYWDNATRTLTWEGTLLAIIGNPPVGVNRVKIGAGSHTFKDSNYSAMYLDLNAITEREENDPAICIKSGAYHLNGYTPKITNIPIAKYDAFDNGFEVINFVNVNEIVGDSGENTGEFIVDNNIHIVIEANSNIQIFRQCSNGNGEYYLCQNFGHHVSPSISCDIWKLDTVYVYKKVGDKFNKVYSEPMIKAGEWECALREVGQPDFIGGVAHGDEMLSSIKFLVDGKSIDLTKSASYTCKKITVIEHSTLYRCDSLMADPVAKHIRYYEISKDDITVTQRVEWLQSLTMAKSYLTMLPICRQYGYNGGETAQPEKPYITSMGITDYDYLPMGLKFDGDKHTNYVHKKGITMAQIWNDGTGYQMTAQVKVLESNNLPNSSMAFTNSGQYNKMYFDYCGDNYVTEIGEVWNNKAVYTYDFKGYIE